MSESESVAATPGMERMFCLDALRALAPLCVVLVHAAAGAAHKTPGSTELVDRQLRGRSRALQMREFVESVRTNTPPRHSADLHAAVRATRMVIKAFDSIRTGQPQEL